SMPARFRSGSAAASTPRASPMTPLATSTPIRSASRRAPPTASASRPPPRGALIVDFEEECCICCAALDSKRSVSLAPCRHSFHTTCATIWLETRSGRPQQTCPLCRTRIHAVEANGTSASPAFPYGDSGQPTRAVLQQEHQPGNIEWLMRETDEQLQSCMQLEAAARLACRSDEYIGDIQSEMRRLEERKETLARLLEQLRRGEWAQQQQPPQQYSAENMREVQARINAVIQAMQRIHQQPRFQFAPGNFLRPTEASVAARAVPPRRPRAAATQQQPPLLPNGTAAATQFRPATVPMPFRAGRPTASSMARERVAPAAAAVPTQPRSAHLRRQQPALPATGRVSVPAAGPARRRLAATSASPRAVAASPSTRGRRSNREQADVRGQEVDIVVVHEAPSDVVVVEVEQPPRPAPNVFETPRRSERIAAMLRRFGSMEEQPSIRRSEEI
ncbi:hypothetical protein PENTCL1PPCAC_3017, partial [Pristionchus entomophagus]